MLIKPTLKGRRKFVKMNRKTYNIIQKWKTFQMVEVHWTWHFIFRQLRLNFHWQALVSNAVRSLMCLDIIEFHLILSLSFPESKPEVDISDCYQFKFFYAKKTWHSGGWQRNFRKRVILKKRSQSVNSCGKNWLDLRNIRISQQNTVEEEAWIGKNYESTRLCMVFMKEDRNYKDIAKTCLCHASYRSVKRFGEGYWKSACIPFANAFTLTYRNWAKTNKLKLIWFFEKPKFQPSVSSKRDTRSL